MQLDRIDGRRRRFAAVMCTAIVTLALLAAAPPAEAHAQAQNDLIVFDDDSSCDVSMQDIHKSGTVDGDISAAVDVWCHPPGSPRGNLVVEEITAQTTISFSENPPIPFFNIPAEIGTCEKIVRTNRYSATLPCHQLGLSNAGYYVATSTVTVTFRGQTEEVRVSRQAFDGGFA